MLPPSSQTTAITLLLISVVLVTVECSHNQVAEGSLNQQGVGESAIVPEAEVSSVVDTTISAATMADGLVQRLEDTSTCGKLNIKVMLPESGFYTQDMTDASATLIKDDVGKERRKNGVTWSVLGQFTRTGPTTVREMVMVPARKTKKLKWPMLKKTALHSFYDKESIDCCGTMSRIRLNPSRIVWRYVLGSPNAAAHRGGPGNRAMSTTRNASLSHLMVASTGTPNRPVGSWTSTLRCGPSR